MKNNIYKKRIKLSVGLILGIAMLLGFFAVAAPASAAPMTCHSATLNGHVEPKGAPLPITYWFKYSTSQSTVLNGGGTSTTSGTVNTQNVTSVSKDISGLTENTTYYFVLWVRANGGSAILTPGVESFNTPFCNGPSDTYTVSTDAGTGGYITPGSREVNDGGIATFSVYANSGYEIGDVNGCGGHKTSAHTYTTGVIHNDCTVHASFDSIEDDTYTVTGIAHSGGNITPKSQTVSAGRTASLDINPYSGYSVDDIDSDCGGDWIDGNTWRTDAVNANCTVEVYFDQDGGDDDDNDNNVTVDLTASDYNIEEGDEITLEWESENADSCDATWTNSNDTEGEEDVSPSSTRTYEITCENDDGDEDTDSVRIYVDENNDDDDEGNVTVDLSASKTSITAGDRVTLTWDSDNADSCNLSWSSDDDVSGYDYVYPNSTRTFRVECSNDDDSDSDSVTIYVGSQPNLNYPTVVLYANKKSVPYNGSATVRWITTNATSCYATGGSIGWEGTKSVGPGSFFTGSLTSSKTYSITCSNRYGSASDFVTIGVYGQANPSIPSSLVLVSSSIDRNQPIVPTIDNTRPRPGDEINYTISYQNIGNVAINGLVLRVSLPYEVDYMYSTPSNPIISGNNLVFNLGTLKANGQGSVTIRVRVKDNVRPGTDLNFLATLSYTDAAGYTQVVSADVSAEVWSDEEEKDGSSLAANVFGAGFLPTSLFGWLLLIILVLLLILLGKYLYDQSFRKRTVTTVHPSGRKTVTTTLE